MKLLVALLSIFASSHAFASNSAIMGETIYEKNNLLYGIQARCLDWTPIANFSQCAEFKLFIISPNIEVELGNTIRVRDLILFPESYRSNRKSYTQATNAIMKLIGGTHSGKTVSTSAEIFQQIKKLGGQPIASNYQDQSKWKRIGIAWTMATPTNGRTHEEKNQQERIELFCLENNSNSGLCDAFQLYVHAFNQYTPLSKVYSAYDWLTIQHDFIKSELSKIKPKDKWRFLENEDNLDGALCFAATLGFFGGAALTISETFEFKPGFVMLGSIASPFAILLAGYGIVKLRNLTLKKKYEKKLRNSNETLTKGSHSIAELSNGVVNETTLTIKEESYLAFKAFFQSIPNTNVSQGTAP